MDNRSYVVIGAGPAGMTAAYELAKAGKKVDVYEASGGIGGMAGSFNLWGQRVDYGPHRFFSKDPRINAEWKEVVGTDYQSVNRLTRILYDNKLFYYPLKPFNALFRLGIWKAFLCGLSYVWVQVRPVPKAAQATFEGWVAQRFGWRLYRIFFKTYSEKLWGIPCARLDADFAAQRIKKFSLGVAIQSMFKKNRGEHATLCERFTYPNGGTGEVYEKMACEVERLGGHIHLHTPVKKLTVEGSRITGVELADGTRLVTEEVVSSMPLTVAVRGFPGLPPEVKTACDELHYRNTILVYLRIPAKNIFSDNWMYVHSANLKCGRITNFRNWVPTLYGNSQDTVVAMEYWCNDGDALWKEPDEELVALAKGEMESTKLARGVTITDGHVVRLHGSYPVYEIGYQKPLACIVEYLKEFSGASFIGRYGAFKYNNQDHSILMGLLAAENIVKGTRHDLWAINTDDEYQESGKANS